LKLHHADIVDNQVGWALPTLQNPACCLRALQAGSLGPMMAFDGKHPEN